MNKALFMDRDGVINVEKNYLHEISEFEFIDGVFDTCRAFQKNNFLLIIITNQAGIARGKYTETEYMILTEWMVKRFETEGITINAVYHCPHHPDFSQDCNCRKPSPGMLLQAKHDFNIDMGSSILVGDKESDIEAGRRAGVGINILVKSGHMINEEISNADNIMMSIKNVTSLLEKGNNEI